MVVEGQLTPLTFGAQRKKPAEDEMLYRGSEDETVLHLDVLPRHLED